MKIHIDTTHINKKTSGNKTYLLNLIEYLFKIDNKHNYNLILTKNNKSIFDKYLQHVDYSLINFNCNNNLKKLFIQQIIIPTLLKKSDILFSPNNITSIFGDFHKIVTIHSMHLNLYYNIENKNIISNMFKKLLLKLSSKKADQIVSISRYSKNTFVNFYNIDESKIKTIYHGIEHISKEKKLSKKSDNPVINQLLKRKYILFVSSLHKHKNVEKLINTYIDLHKNYDILNNTKLVIVGKDINNKIVKFKKKLKQINLHQDVYFTKFLENYNDIIRLYKNAHVFIFPSSIEGFGFPPLEAMVYQTPVLANNATSIPEILGDAALYFDIDKEGDFEKKIIKILKNKNLRKNLIKKGLKQTTKYSWKKTAKEMIDLFNKMS
ncbi:MAG: glycosyltransferase family 4 protein [archaeon]